ncbi:MAG: right-handed parallel beta-helix repeat-containing protein [Rubrivivax sp.]|nr:right-handed parallel beta-helix repeat-containing protein [Rubrivivax sp.]
MALAMWVGLWIPHAADAATLNVGPARDIKTLSEAAKRARYGDMVEVDAGEYRRDVAVWTQNDLTIRAVGGRARLIASGGSAEGKAIFVVRGGRVTVEGLDFEGTRVPSRNGAGIRFEAGQLTVRDCRFTDNEMGLLTGNDPQAELTVENSEFAHNKRLDGHNHQLYAGGIGKLTVRGSYFHQGYIGHLLKSRAAVNHLFYNRFTDELGGSASYEVEFPNGGVAVLVGNIVQQSSTSENAILISMGAEGYTWPRHALVLAHNTIVDNRPAEGVFVRVMQGEGKYGAPVAIKAVNNLLVGNPGKLDAAGPGEYRGNFSVDWDVFVRASREDYRLVSGAAVAGKAVDAGEFDGLSLRPTHEYVHPRSTAALDGTARHPGALQTGPQR